MEADSPFADLTERPDTPSTEYDLDAAVARQDAEDAGPKVTDEQLEQVDNLHDAQDADFGPLHELLWQAGAHIDPLLLAEWTPEQVDEASEWARAQIAATAADEPGKRTSVKWPDHVSAAHHESAAGGVDTSIPGAAAPLDQVLTECRCEKCGTKAKWVGPLTADMLAETFTRGVDEASGLPNCVHCGTAMVPVQFLKTEDAISKAAEQLDAARAGDAARPLHQPSIPGIHPEFDWRRAQLRTEALETSVAAAEDAWDDAKEVAADCKKTFDGAVDHLRKQIQETHRARIDAEYQHGKGSGPIAPVPDQAAAPSGVCITERTTGKPCRICRDATAAPTNGQTPQHLAAAIAMQANEETLEAETLAEAIEELTKVIIPVDDLALWTSEDFQAVARYLEEYAAASIADGDALVTIGRPNILGRPHEVGEIGGGCRVCGALLQKLAELEAYPNGFPIGTLVGLDCPGEAAVEPARQAKPRHAKPADRQKAKNEATKTAKDTKDTKDTKKKPAKATLKSGAKKGSKKS